MGGGNRIKEGSEIMKCEKCKKQEGTECVYYTTVHEGYLCRSCYDAWCKLAKAITKAKGVVSWLSECKTLEGRYLNWLAEK